MNAARLYMRCEDYQPRQTPAGSPFRQRRVQRAEREREEEAEIRKVETMQVWNMKGEGGSVCKRGNWEMPVPKLPPVNLRSPPADRD